MSQPPTPSSTAHADSNHAVEHKKGGLGVLTSTAICGNDITSSCLYVSALSIAYAGRWAPVCLLFVSGTLFLFRAIYAEVVGALPLNGGAYNALLNTTSKYRASIAACLTILSYMATAVISSNEAMHYLHALWDGLPILGATIGLLAFFMALTMLGITESAVVAVVIFVMHLASMGLLLLLGLVAVLGGGLDVLTTNLSTPAPGGIFHALFFGFAAAMLGISGFESSANFVEQQAEGVFPKTLRNMWIAVTVLNPGIAILALALVPSIEIRETYQNALLSHLGDLSGGAWLTWVIGINAVLVLSGATLTSYVGVTGLIERMTLDRCLPQWLLRRNRRGSSHRIIGLFFLLTVSVLLITRGELGALAAVYTLSFLSVMALFAAGNILLKVKRARLPRPSRAGWLTVFAGLGAVLIAIYGNARLNAEYLVVFLEYLVPTVLVVTVMLTRLELLRLSVFFLDELRRRVSRERRDAIDERDLSAAARWTAVRRQLRRFDDWIHRRMSTIAEQQIVFFTRGDNLHNLNRVMLYIADNEHTSRVKVVTVVPPGSEPPPRLAEQLRFLNEAYPEMDVEFIVIDGMFTPALIDELSKKWNIPKNLMFIGSPGDGFLYGIAELEGVRLIV